LQNLFLVLHDRYVDAVGNCFFILAFLFKIQIFFPAKYELVDNNRIAFLNSNG